MTDAAPQYAPRAGNLDPVGDRLPLASNRLLGSELVPAFNIRAYGAMGDGTHDDTAAIQAAITAAQAVGGTVRIPRGLYRLTASLVVSSYVAIEGDGCHGLYGSIATQGYAEAVDYPTVAPYLAGSVLLMVTPATDVIRVTIQGQSCQFRDFGIRFADAIAFANTGHGVNCVPPNLPSTGTDPGTGIAYGGLPDWGVASATFERLWVFGNDGSHYAYRFVNLTLCTLTLLHSVGGPHLELYANTNFVSPGNSTITQCYGAWICGGTGHGIHSHKSGLTAGMILNTFVRPQVNAMKVPIGSPFRTAFPSIPTIDPATQHIVRFDAGSLYTTILAPDFEGGLDVPISVDIAVNAQQFVMLPGIAKGMGDYYSGVYMGKAFRATSDGIRALIDASGNPQLSFLTDGAKSYLDFYGTDLVFRKNDGSGTEVWSLSAPKLGAELRAAVSSTVTFSAANDVFQYVTGLTIDLLAPRRYLVLGNFRVGTASGASVYSYLQLRNATTATEISGTRKLVHLIPGGGAQLTVGFSWVITTTAAMTLQVHATANNGQVQYLADNAGGTDLIVLPM